MAVVGDQLLQPETGWKRYTRHKAGNYVYKGANWTYGSNQYYTQGLNENLEFQFYGTKLRYIAPYHSSHSDNVTIDIDGTLYTFTQYHTSTTAKWTSLQFEVTGLTEGFHQVKVYSTVTTGERFEAIDVDDTGRLLHPDEVTDPKELAIGKRIRCHYTGTSNAVGAFSNLGKEMYVDGINDFIPPASSATPDGDFYYIMVEKDRDTVDPILVADRNIHHSISWDELNNHSVANGNGVETYFNEIPDMTSNTSPEGVASASSEYTNGTTGEVYSAYKAFDNDPSTFWHSINDANEWLSYEFTKEIEIDSYSLTSRENSEIQMPKSWRLQGYNTSTLVWDDLHTVTGHTNWLNNHPHSFTLDSTGKYKTYRIYVDAMQDPTNYPDAVIAGFEMYEKNDYANYYTRLLTGGIDSTDTDNEWDNWIVNSTLGGTITAGDDAVWHWNQDHFTWTSTTDSAGSSYRVHRGQNSSGISLTAWGSATTNTVGGSTNGYWSFRPVLVINFYYLNKALFNFNSAFQKWDGIWSTVSTTLPTKTQFVSDGIDIDYIHMLDRKIQDVKRDFSSPTALGGGNQFSSRVDLKVFFDLRGFDYK